MTKENFIAEVAKYVQKYAPEYGVLVCSPIIAQFCLESGYGTSELAVYANNFCGLKYHKEISDKQAYIKVGSEQSANGQYTSSLMKWCNFNSLENCVKGYFRFLFCRSGVTRYENLKGITSPQKYLEIIRADGYATSLKYVENNMRVITDWNLTKYDKKENTNMGSINTGLLTGIKINGITINTNIPCNAGNYNNYANRNVNYVVMHYTGNQKDAAVNNAKYFQTGGRNASAHFFVDDSSIYQSVELRDAAWHCGGSTYYHSACRNTNSIGIEMCCTAGNYKISETTKNNAAYLCAHICKLLGITANSVDTYVLRHYDVTHKSCPAQMAGANNAEWNAFKSKVKSILNGSSTSTPTPIPTPTPVQPTSSLQAIGLVHAKNFTGVADTNVLKAKQRVLQRAINLDYKAKIAEDGDFGINSRKALGSHYVEYGEKQYMVTGAEILMYLNGFDPKGLELPGEYGDGLVSATKAKFGGTGRKITSANFLTLIQ